MSRARTRKQEEKRQFLEDYPEAVEHDTQLSVAQNPFSGLFDVQAEGSKGMLVNYEDDVDMRLPEITLLGDLDTEEIDFDFLTGEDEARLTLTEDGMGILGEDENIFRKSDGALKRDARDIREGEVLDTDLRGLPFDGRRVEVHEGGEDEMFGVTGVNIEFTVLNNKSGTVELILPPSEMEEMNLRGLEGPGRLITFDVDQGSKGLADNIGAVALDGEVFGGFQFTVSGDVQVALTGIDFSTNYDGMIEAIS